MLNSIEIFIQTNFLFVYWIPVALSFVAFIDDFVEKYKTDKNRCHKEHYNPELTVGHIIGSIMICFIPALNIIIATVFFIPTISSLFSIPIVAKKYKQPNDDQEDSK